MTDASRSRPFVCLPLVAALALAVPASLHAQTAGRVIEQSVPRPPSPERAPLPATVAPAPGAVPLERDATFVLREVALSGATAVAPERIATLWDGRIGEPFSLSAAAALAAEVQALFRDEGFVFTRVIAAVPDPAAGRVEIRVVEARIDSVTVEEPDGPVGPVRTLLEAMAEPLRGLSNPRLADLERVLLMMNEVPGITRATAVPRAGQSGAGSLDLSVNVSRRPVSGALFADNRQNPAFGEGLLGGLVQVGSYGSGGDTTQLTGTVTFWDEAADFDERQIIELRQSRYIGGSGLRLTGRALYGRSRPGDLLEPLDLRGEDVELGVELDYPLILTRPFSLRLRGGFEAIENRLDLPGGIPVTDDSRRVLFGEAELLRRDPSGYTEATLGLRQGLGIFGASDEGDANLSRFDGDPAATVVYGSLEREQRFGEGFSLFGRVEAQYAAQPLLSDEEFSLGGTSFGRGYDPSELLGDHGVGATVELRWQHRVAIDTTFLTFELYGFTDIGRVWNRGEGTPGVADLASWGGGIRTFLPADVFVELELAKPTTPLERNDEDDARVFLSLQKRF